MPFGWRDSSQRLCPKRKFHTVTRSEFIDAVKGLCICREDYCGVADIIFGLQSATTLPQVEVIYTKVDKLNESQNKAIQLALESSLLCLWGPPGTEKTETIVEMICALQIANEKARVLVTAPTHNAVNNVMRRYIKRIQEQPLAQKSEPNILRVSTEVRKVADDLRKYICDAMAGQEIHGDYKTMKKAIQMIKDSDTVFTTCIGAGIGLLRSEFFDIVIVDEASQQTEPSSLVPLVKGCSKAILVGDHVQLRPTVQQTSLALEFDVSRFERLYTEEGGLTENGFSTMMLDTQYRMHPKLCEFSSGAFYEGKLKSRIDMSARPLIKSDFPFPSVEIQGKSKENKGQAELCVHICKLLTSQNDTQSIVVLTPYTRQAKSLKRMLPSTIEVSSIDRFQVREADVIVFVTVRCNEHRSIGFLKDMRRMNVALTRARSAVIVIGHRATLTEGTEDDESSAMWKRLLRSLTEVKVEVPTSGDGPADGLKGR
ncbi:hypothetical protein HYE67_005531 [Fusarium culmorum]|uniref:Regulator of nonsense transcripts 1 n=1 Tax=Fusarium culmorum TaxID=5516 RepID=A0A7S8D7Q0_FUSCU|nr:hypothetical protein HYE67_005531 [Fusarium culmorum]